MFRTTFDTDPDSILPCSSVEDVRFSGLDNGGSRLILTNILISDVPSKRVGLHGTVVMRVTRTKQLKQFASNDMTRSRVRFSVEAYVFGSP